MAVRARPGPARQDEDRWDLVFVKACINGDRLPGKHPALPVSATQIAAEALAAVRAGAGAVHLHVKDGSGADTLAGEPVSTVLEAVRDVVPDVPIGVTTGAWALPDPTTRTEAVRAWANLPDFASVNWHEDGAEEVAQALLDKGVGVEAGLWHESAVDAWARSPLRDQCLRVLVEVQDGPDQDESVRVADRLLAAVASTGARLPVLLHGEGSSCWPVLRRAARLGLDARIGLEDTLVLPDGSPASGNAALVRAALRVIDEERG